MLLYSLLSLNLVLAPFQHIIHILTPSKTFEWFQPRGLRVREEIMIIGDPSETPCHRRTQLPLNRRPQYFIGDPNIFIRDPKYFQMTPQYLHMRPLYSHRKTNYYHGDPNILIPNIFI